MKARFFHQLRLANYPTALAATDAAALFGEAAVPLQNDVVALSNIHLAFINAPAADTEAPGNTPVPAAVIAGLSLYSEQLRQQPGLDTRGLVLQVAPQAAPQRVNPGSSNPDIHSIDHIVLRTSHADDCIRLFAHALGMRLALDQQVPQWGGRMLFFREGGLTLEVIESTQEPAATDYFWGISYRCNNIEQTAERLRERGVSLSEIREGRKPGTRVATIESHCFGIPSLLLG